MAHVHAEVEKPPIDDTHLAPVRRFPTGATAPAGMVDAHPPCRPGLIADMRHIRNGTGPYCTIRSYAREQPQRPQGASLLNHRQIP